MTMSAASTEHVATLRADLAAAEHELDRTDALGDAGAVVRVRITLEPRIVQLRRAIADAERVRLTTTEVNRCGRSF